MYSDFRRLNGVRKVCVEVELSRQIQSLLAPTAEAAPQHDRFALAEERWQGTDWIHLQFLDSLTNSRFVVRLARPQPGQRRFAPAGRLDLTLDLEPQLQRQPEHAKAVETFVRALAQRIDLNTRSYNQSEINAIFDPPRNAYAARHGSIPSAKRVDLRVGHMCNEKCVFCTDVNQRGWQHFRPAAEWKEQLQQMRARGSEGVLVVGNEPTLRADLPEILAEAKRLGFREIELSTNGVRLSDRSYFQEILAAGMNTLSLSVHGHDVETEGVNTGRPDLVLRRRQCLQNFAELVGDRQAQIDQDVFLVSATVLTRYNVPHLPKIVAYLDQFQVTHMSLHYPWITGDAETQFDAVVPDYPSVMEAVAPLLPRLLDPSSDILLSNIPPCVARGMQRGRTPEKTILLPQGQREKTAGQGSHETRFEDKVVPMDPTLVHVPVCRQCAYRERCGGVPAMYYQRFGEAGLRAL